MNVRHLAVTGTFGAVLAAATVAAGIAAAAPAQQVPAPAGALDAGQAQYILRSVVDPRTPVAQAAAEIDSTDPSVGPKIHAFAVSAYGAGYTPDVFTVVSVTPAGPNLDNTDTEVRSPHFPVPVPFPMSFVRTGGVWKLTADSANKLIGMTGGPHH